jgi:hypothetical protein
MHQRRVGRQSLSAGPDVHRRWRLHQHLCPQDLRGRRLSVWDVGSRVRRQSDQLRQLRQRHELQQRTQVCVCSQDVPGAGKDLRHGWQRLRWDAELRRMCGLQDVQRRWRLRERQRTKWHDLLPAPGREMRRRDVQGVRAQDLSGARPDVRKRRQRVRWHRELRRMRRLQEVQQLRGLRG